MRDLAFTGGTSSSSGLGACEDNVSSAACKKCIPGKLLSCSGFETGDEGLEVLMVARSATRDGLFLCECALPGLLCGISTTTLDCRLEDGEAGLELLPAEAASEGTLTPSG